MHGAGQGQGQGLNPLCSALLGGHCNLCCLQLMKVLGPLSVSLLVVFFFVFYLHSIPGDKKNSPTTATTSKNHLTQRRRQALRGKNSPVLRKTPHKGLMQVNRHRLCCLPSSRTHLSTKEASSVHMGIPPSNKVIKTRYRIVKKTPSSSFGAPSFPSSLPSWRARRIPLSRCRCPTSSHSEGWHPSG